MNADDRWPFAFTGEDIEVRNTDAIGVVVTHPLTGAEVAMSVLPTRDENLQAALRRLDREVRRRQGGPLRPPQVE
jgi:hypothetical protein